MSLDQKDHLESSSAMDVEVERSADTFASIPQQEWHMAAELRRLEGLDSHTGVQPRKLGISWNNLTIKGVNSGLEFNENVLSLFNPLHKKPKGVGLKTIFDASHGCVDAEKLAGAQLSGTHTLIGTPSACLSIEQRKRLTSGVELVANPSILIFLDEPTSGLDGQAAFNTARFLRKLSAAG